MASHQTITLSAGRHRSPEDGACAMELASMLAHEQFSDHPASVCPVIAAFIRSYNDHVDDERRRDLYRYASRAVGTNGGVVQERTRASMCMSWARMSCAPPPLRVRLLHRLLRSQGPDIDAVYAARAAATDPAVHRQALALLDELIALQPASRAVCDRIADQELLPHTDDPEGAKCACSPGPCTTLARKQSSQEAPWR